MTLVIATKVHREVNEVLALPLLNGFVGTVRTIKTDGATVPKFQEVDVAAVKSLVETGVLAVDLKTSCEHLVPQGIQYTLVGVPNQATELRHVPFKACVP